MTDRQKQLYFKLWGRVCQQQDWYMASKRLVGQREEVYGLNPVNELYQAIWDHADKLAEAAHRAITPDDLRHACHRVALGRDVSSKDFSNKQLDRVLTIFKLLINRDDIDAQIAWDHPENADKKRLIHAIKQLAPEAYITTICAGRRDWTNYQAPFWEDLELPQLRQLAMTLRNRAAAKQQPIAATPQQPDFVNVGASREVHFENAPF